MTKIETIIKLIFMIVILPLQIISAQHQMPYGVTSGGGGKVSSTNNIISFTLGESTVGKCSNASGIGMMGFWSVYQQDVLTSVDDEGQIPVEYKLEQNYPNPFNPTTTIKFAVAEKSRVIIKIYNITGEEITTLVNEEKDRGWYEIKFNSNGLSSGIYLCRMQAGNYVSIKKMMLLK
ncbi:MAG: T9SS type A sorting domain-containing protein [Ignavibacterium sp.]